MVLMEELRKTVRTGKSIEFYLASAIEIMSCLKRKIASMTEHE